MVLLNFGIFSFFVSGTPCRYEYLAYPLIPFVLVAAKVFHIGFYSNWKQMLSGLFEGVKNSKEICQITLIPSSIPFLFSSTLLCSFVRQLVLDPGKGMSCTIYFFSYLPADL